MSFKWYVVSSHEITVLLIRYPMPFLLNINRFNYKSFYMVIELIDLGRATNVGLNFGVVFYEDLQCLSTWKHEML